MNHAEFSKQMDRLREVYGDRAYTAERVKLIFRQVQDESASWWLKCVDYLIGVCRQPPLSMEINEQLLIERERKWESSKHNQLEPIKSEWNCWCCKGTGVFICSQKMQPGWWAFRCACEKGLQDRRTAIPFYTQEHARDGFVFIDKPVFMGGA